VNFGIHIKVVAPVLGSCMTNQSSMIVVWSGLSWLPKVVGVISYLNCTDEGSVYVNITWVHATIMSTFRGSLLYLFSSILFSFFLSYVNLRHCQKAWPGVSSDFMKTCKTMLAIAALQDTKFMSYVRY
jgi:hypothetical protein